ncbi:hypothetical protein A5660_16635 [Mycobacterium alsense]|nr:hypothetical protein A5660_16635 [Mycobacterium alsense]
MQLQTRARRSLPGRNASNGAVRADNLLSFMDQAMFRTLRALDRNAIVQCVWVYEHPVNVEGLRRFHHDLGCGLLGRRIERSPLPFARDRWVRDRWPAGIDMAESARPRAELSDWLDERAQLPVDPERGPGWHLGVLPLTDGSTAVTLVASHCLIDGLGIGNAVAEAAGGHTRELGYPPPSSRTRPRALAQDARQTIRDVPAAVRAAVAAAKMARDPTQGAARTRPPQPTAARKADSDERVVVPAISIHIDKDEWDARARALGGSSHHLVAGLAAKLGERLGRRRAGDGAVVLQIPLSDRAENDTRANTLSYVSIDVDPAGVTTDLSATRAAVRRTFETLREAPERASPMLPLAPLVPFTPKGVLKRVTEAAFAYDDLPVANSSMGDIAPIAARPDGTEAECVFGRGGIQGVKRHDLERAGGELALWCLRIGGKMCITVAAYRPGKNNSKPELRDLAAHTLAEFDLSGVIE